MLLELAWIETVGRAAALAENAEIATKVRKGPKDFILSQDLHSSRFALWCEVFPVGEVSAQGCPEGRIQLRWMRSNAERQQTRSLHIGNHSTGIFIGSKCITYGEAWIPSGHLYA